MIAVNRTSLHDLTQRYAVVLGSLYLLVMTFAWAGSLDGRVENLGTFENVHISGSLEVNISQDRVQSVQVQGDASSLDLESVDGTLYIDNAGTSPVAISIALPELNEVVVRGAAEVTMSGFHGDTLVLDGANAGGDTGRIVVDRMRFDHLLVSSSGQFDFDLHGTATHQDVSIHGTGRYGAEGLLSQTSVVAVTGVGVVSLWAEQLLDLDVDGRAQIVYLGTPWVNKQISGSASVEPRFTHHTTSL